MGPKLGDTDHTHHNQHQVIQWQKLNPEPMSSTIQQVFAHLKKLQKKHPHWSSQDNNCCYMGINFLWNYWETRLIQQYSNHSFRIFSPNKKGTKIMKLVRCFSFLNFLLKTPCKNPVFQIPQNRISRDNKMPLY